MVNLSLSVEAPCSSETPVQLRLVYLRPLTPCSGETHVQQRPPSLCSAGLLVHLRPLTFCSIVPQLGKCLKFEAIQGDQAEEICI